MKYFKYTEENDWEGEVWKVFFKVEDDKVPMINKLNELLSSNSQYDEYSLEEVDKIPDLSFMEDDSDGYFPEYSELSIIFDKVETLIKLIEAGGEVPALNMLNKLGLFL